MKQTLLKQLNKLEKLCLIERYGFNAITTGEKQLLITITLRKGDAAQLAEVLEWVKHSA